MGLRMLLQIIGFIVLAFIGLIVLLKILGFISIVASMLIGVGLLVGFVWIIWKLLQMGGGDGDAASSQAESSYKLFNATKNPVALFLETPAIADLLAAERADNHAPLVEAGKILKVDSEVAIKVLDDSKSEIVKIKVLDGSTRGKTGWVARSAVVKTNN